MEGFPHFVLTFNGIMKFSFHFLFDTITDTVITELSVETFKYEYQSWQRVLKTTLSSQHIQEFKLQCGNTYIYSTAATGW